MKLLCASEQRYHSLFLSMSEGFLIGRLIRDTDGRTADFAILDVNPACEKLTGIGRERLVGRRISEIAPADEPAWLRHISEMMGGDEVARFEEYSASAGKWLKVYAFPLDRNDVFAAVIVDTTEHRQADEALQKSEAFLNNVFDSIQDGISVLDRDLNIVRTNHIMEEWYPHALPLPGKKCYQMYHGRTVPCDVCPSLRAIAGKTRQNDIVPYRDARGDIVGWLELSVFPLLDANGDVTGAIEHVRNITKRKLAEEALRESEEKFRAVAETASMAICIIQDEKFQYVNPAMEAISGYTKEELATTDFTALVHPEALPHIRAQYDRWLAGASPEARYELRGVRKDAEVRWADVSRKTISYRGRPALLLTGVDITGRKQMEEALRHSEERYRLLTENSPDFIYIIDREFKVKFVNQAGATALEKRPEDVIGQGLASLFPPDTAAGMKAGLSRVFDTGKPYSSEFVHHLYQGDFYMHVALTPVFDDRGNVISVMGVSRDINGLKKAEAELREAKEQAELYVDLMGHDINNMHQMALGYLEIARDVQTDEVLKTLLDKPIEALQRSARLIKNVRKLQKFREGTMSVQMIDLCAVLADLQREFGALPGSRVDINLNGHKDCYVRADELLYDVFANLAGNAVKHTGGGSGISVSLDDVTDEGRRCYAVSVEDHGPGIPDDFKDLIFKRLLKGTSNAKGSGIGLYLVKSLVDSYRGKVWVEDRVPGDHTKGARFVVMLPAAEL